MHFGLKPDLPVGGRLRNWEKLTQDQVILEAVSGFQVPFVEQPRQLTTPHKPRFSTVEEKNIMEEIQKMLQKNAIEKVQPEKDQFLSHSFLRPKKDGTNRPVFNLRSLNKFVQYEHF